MRIPKHLQQPDMTPEHKKRVEAFVNENRRAMKDAPAYDTAETATQVAVQMAKKEKYSFPSVWAEPQDIGNQHAVVHTNLREKAQNAGYTEEVGEQKIFDLANGRDEDETDEIEEA